MCGTLVYVRSCLRSVRIGCGCFWREKVRIFVQLMRCCLVIGKISSSERGLCLRFGIIIEYSIRVRIVCDIRSEILYLKFHGFIL